MFPLPSLKVGILESITPLRSFPPTRAALFDVAIGGPGASMLTSIALLVSGLSLTITSRSQAKFPTAPAAVMKSSFMVGQLVTIVAPTIMLAPLSQPAPIQFIPSSLSELLVLLCKRSICYQLGGWMEVELVLHR
jgi:hypothetical protein